MAVDVVWIVLVEETSEDLMLLASNYKAKKKMGKRKKDK